MSCSLIQMEIPLCYVQDEHTSNTPWAATCDTIYIAVNYCVRGSVKWPYVVYHRSIINVFKYVDPKGHTAMTTIGMLAGGATEFNLSNSLYVDDEESNKRIHLDFQIHHHISKTLVQVVPQKELLSYKTIFEHLSYYYVFLT